MPCHSRLDGPPAWRSAPSASRSSSTDSTQPIRTRRGSASWTPSSERHFSPSPRSYGSSRRPPGSPPWLDVVDRFTPVRAASFGAFLSGANPKVVALSLGAALSLADAQASLLASLATVALFTVIGAAGVVVPTAAYVALPGHGAAPLAAFRGWLARHERTVLIVLALAIGGFFLRDGLTLLMT